MVGSAKERPTTLNMGEFSTIRVLRVEYTNYLIQG